LAGALLLNKTSPLSAKHVPMMPAASVSCSLQDRCHIIATSGTLQEAILYSYKFSFL